MKRLLLFIVIGLIVVVVGANWYYTSQVRDQLDRMANAVSMFGTLSYDSVRLSPGGDININDLSFRLHQGQGGIDIDRISLQTDNILALLTLQSTLEGGRLPESLGMRIDNIQFPLDGALATMSRQAPGNPSPTAASGILFDAAGCNGRAQFTADDLMQMDYFDIRADIEVQYRLLDNGDRLRLFASARTHEASAMHLQATLDLPSGSLTTQDMARSMPDARLDSFSLEYEELGYYDRMLAFCADEMSMSQSEYIAHHLEAWKQAWSRFGAEPGPDVVAAYESFLQDPKQLSVSSDSEQSVSLEGIERYTMSGLLERMNVGMAVNYGDAQPLDIIVEGAPARTASSDPSPDAASPSAPSADNAQASAETGDTDLDTVAAAAADTETSADDSEAETPDGEAAEPASRWVKVDPGVLKAHRDQRLRVLMNSGDRHAGRLSRVDSDNIHIRVERVGGFYIRPLAREKIREVEVYGDS
jgi:hypothetical protein